MDRSDERKENRSGDVLGIGGSIRRDENLDGDDVRARAEDEERRRRRMSEGADEVAPSRDTGVHRGSGATGIDMGAGGEGTDLESK